MSKVTKMVLNAVLSILVLAGCAAKPTQKPVASGSSDNAQARVSEVRRILRSACGKLKSINAGAQNSDDLLAKAQAETERTLSLWVAFLKGYGNAAPGAYASHPDWPSATRQISSGIREMRDQINAKAPAHAFKACGRTCGRFVALNEAAKIRRTSDMLFRFRKAAKPLAQQCISGKTSQVNAAIPTLLKLRDEALTAPRGGIGTSDKKKEALRVFSYSVDLFTEACRANNARDLPGLYKEMMKSMEKAYDLFL